jgi:hypothetical protein
MSNGFRSRLPRIKILVTTRGTLKGVFPEVLGKILPKPYATSDLLGACNTHWRSDPS